MNKIVAITGGFGNLGVAVGRAFKIAGANVALIDRAATPPDEVLREFGEHLLLGNVDLARPEDAQDAFSAVVAKWGALDSLINIAGGFTWETIGEGDADTWDRMYSINLKTAFNATRAASILARARRPGPGWGWAPMLRRRQASHG
jgi:NAD(P)-dependent dehydrogenase (short-subunit alcohol dehydrogenase family)